MIYVPSHSRANRRQLKTDKDEFKRKQKLEKDVNLSLFIPKGKLLQVDESKIYLSQFKKASLASYEG